MSRCVYSHLSYGGYVIWEKLIDRTQTVVNLKAQHPKKILCLLANSALFKYGLLVREHQHSLKHLFIDWQGVGCFSNDIIVSCFILFQHRGSLTHQSGRRNNERGFSPPSIFHCNFPFHFSLLPIFI